MLRAAVARGQSWQLQGQIRERLRVVAADRSIRSRAITGAFAAGWMFVASKMSAAGTVALGLLAGYLEGLVPGLPPRAVAVGATVGFTVLNYFGVRRSSRANLAIVFVSGLAILATGMLGRWLVRRHGT